MIRDGVRRMLHLALRRRDRWEREVEEEITFHLTLRAEQLAAQGQTARAAYDEAVRRFGPLTESRARLIDAARHREHRMQRMEFVADLRQDITFALRTLARAKGWTAITVLTFALGIGATTAVFSVVSTLLLHPVTYPHADRVVYAYQQPATGNNTGIRVTIVPSAPVIRAWQSGSHAVESIEGYSSSRRALKTTSEPSTVNTSAIFPSFPAFAGERPLFGRMFTEEETRDGTHVVLLGESIWRERFGADRGVIGKSITLGDSSYVIIGVMPGRLRIPGTDPEPTDMWIPLNVRNDSLAMLVVARLVPGARPDAAMRELDTLFARSAGFTAGKIPFTSIVVRPGDRLQFHDSLVLLTWAVALVLVVACANVAHLLLARSSTRQRELAIRAALGAGRSRILRQLLTESAILAAVGTVLGVAVGWAGLQGLISLRPESLDALTMARLDTTTVALALGIGIACTIAFALIGGGESAKQATHESLKTGSVGVSASRRQQRARGLLVVTEMAMSALLIVGATMLVRSVGKLQSADLGFDPRGLYTIAIPFDAAHVDAPESRAAFLHDYLQRIRRMPRVQSVAVAGVTPGMRWFKIGALEVEGRPAPESSASSFIDENPVENSYFTTMRIPLERGSLFTDTSAAAGQMIVNASFARKTWPNGEVLGQRIRVGLENWHTIVGVVGDARTSGPLAESTAPMLYTPGDIIGQPAVLIRTTGDAASLAPAIAVLTQMGVKRPPPIESVERIMALSIAARRFLMLLLTVFTVLALVLASIGMYGVMSCRVAQTTREIGVRVALGATRARIGRGVLGRGMSLALVGAAVGLGAATWSTKLIEHELYGVSRLDPRAFAVGGTVLLLVAALACVIPARRALSVDPMAAIRAD